MAMAAAMEFPEPIATTDPEDMEMEADSIAINQPNGSVKRVRHDEENDPSKKQKLETSVEEERLENLDAYEEKKDEGEGGENGEGTGNVSLGPKLFGSSVEMFDYFYKFLHFWAPNLDINKYEHMVLLDLLKKGGNAEGAEKKIGEGGIRAFHVRYHPTWKSRCFFFVRADGSSDDFSFRKCIHHILPLPENMQVPPISGDGKKDGGGRGGRGGWGRGGRGGRGRRGRK